MRRIGIVGCGRILAAHLRGYRLLREAGVDDFRITALCSRKADDARMYVNRGDGPPQRPAVSDIPGDPLAVGDEYLSDFQNDTHVEIFTDYRQMIADGPIDAVNDFTTHALHHQVAAVAIEHRKDLLTQKPLAVTMRAGQRICDDAEARDLVLGVFENARFNAQTRHLRWLWDSGRLGDLQMVLLGNVGTWWAPNRIVAETPWRHRKIEAGGISLDLGVHQFDVIRYLAGEVDNIEGRTAILEPVRVTLAPSHSPSGRGARGEGSRVTDQIDCDADDTVYASFATEQNVTGNLFASWGGHGEPTVTEAGFVFYASKGRVTGNSVTTDDGSKAELSTWYSEGCDAARKERDFPLGLVDSFALAQHDWLQAVRHRRPPETSGREGLRDLACAFAILESAQAGRRVDVEEVLNGTLREYQKPIDEHFGLT